MSTAPPNPYAQMQPPPAPPKKSGLSGCAIAGIGCGIAALLGIIVLVVLIVAGGYWFVRQGPAFVESALIQDIQASQLPADEQQVFIDRIERFTDDYEAGAITLEQYGQELEAISTDVDAAIQQHQSGGAPTAPQLAPAEAGDAP